VFSDVSDVLSVAALVVTDEELWVMVLAVALLVVVDSATTELDRSAILASMTARLSSNE